jgi:hypothetical protein
VESRAERTGGRSAQQCAGRTQRSTNSRSQRAELTADYGEAKRAGAISSSPQNAKNDFAARRIQIQLSARHFQQKVTKGDQRLAKVLRHGFG